MGKIAGKGWGREAIQETVHERAPSLVDLRDGLAESVDLPYQ